MYKVLTIAFIIGGIAVFAGGLMMLLIPWGPLWFGISVAVIGSIWFGRVVYGVANMLFKED